ncbi:phage major capsid protein [Paracoccus suum]|uniref:Phage major capsid protein n=1 Tax=Paracoccus suum TaxID=2259340 RepID=A0A344PL00_9RHOB|nr:phage major capsid protein [Paracoccus suum]AXC50055.1 phage major capsid protein [Paracoccus suum]
MNRAYSILTAKALQDGDERVIEGVASTPSPDRMGDVVEPMGAKFALPLPLLWQHNHDEAVGTVEFAEPNAKGIPFRARLAKVEEDGDLKKLVDKAWQAVKAGLVRGVSIGFNAREPERLKTGGLRFTDWEWLELSLVTIPANAEATISAIKSISRQQIAASGEGEISPGASGTPVKISTKGVPKMALAEQIASLEAKRAANAARMEEIATKSINRGETMAADEHEEFDGLQAEVDQVDADLSRLKALERVKLAAAKPVAGQKASDHESRDPATVPGKVRLAEKVDKGINFARLAKVKALAQLDVENPREIAKRLYGEDSAVYGVITKAAVPAGATLDGNWAEWMVTDEGRVFGDFLEYLRPRTILGRFGQNGVPSLRNVPADTTIGAQTGGGEAYWVGEGKAKPLTKFEGETNKLSILKVANIAVVTEELLRKSGIAAEAFLRDQLTAAIATRLDKDFIDPAKAAVAGVSPASITNGLTPIVSAGGTADNIRADIQALFGSFIAAKNAPTNGVWIMSASAALSLSMMINPLGQPEFPGLTMTGGTFAGLPVIVSDYAPAGLVVLANASDIYLVDEGGVQVAMSREASLEMSDSPTHNSTTPTPIQLVSMFQTNSVAFRAERFINWARRRPSGVAVITQATWAGYDATP